MTYEGEFRVGDVLSVACPFTETVVESGVARDELSLRWPWWSIDTDSDLFHWNGVVALDAGSMDAPAENSSELFRTEPPPHRLRAGDLCRVGVPPTLVHVTSVDRHDPPLETGWLSRPTLTVTVLRQGVSYREYPDGSHLDGFGYALHPGDGTPFTFELLMRPYAFLRAGDEVADAAGRAWLFRGPWDWHAFDGGPPGPGPAWPLVLLTRSTLPRSAQEAEGEAVATGTATGSHEDTVRRWTSLTGASPKP
ncbi:hypothetical protein ACFYPN_14630 [Streptomyces sp. NPDC005576]|uniref:hypothetical protein n=1 Tax=Streptomyces sp. NPDC005576 TaxID=3364726 RepID=UPI0036ADF5D0